MLEISPDTNRITIRLPKPLLCELRQEANKKDLPISSLVIKILNKNVMVDKRFKSMPTITIPQVLFMKFIENMEDSTLDRIAKAGPMIVKKICKLSEWKYDIESVINNHFMILAKYFGWFHFTFEINHFTYRLIFETHMDECWKKFVSKYVKNIIESLNVCIEDESIDDNVIIFKCIKRQTTV
jgi:hypothetical protein